MSWVSLFYVFKHALHMMHQCGNKYIHNTVVLKKLTLAYNRSET